MTYYDHATWIAHRLAPWKGHDIRHRRKMPEKQQNRR